MRFWRQIWLSTLVLIGANSLRAENLVELFTSQGCGTCYVADDYLAELDQSDDFIGLTFHIDYWNYLGWEDTFAQSQFTERQVGYQKRYQSKQLYTPQFVVGGRYSFAGDNLDAVAASQEILGEAITFDIDVTDQADHIAFQIRSPELGGEYDVWVAYVWDEASVTIEAGENIGRTLRYTNVVRDMLKLGTWSSAGLETFEAKKAEGQGMVLILQEPNFGAVAFAKEIFAPLT